MNLSRSHNSVVRGHRFALSSRGVALVVTLIMLSVITFLAVAFLALSRRERASTSVAQSQTDARLMADAALARAEAELIARMVSRTNPFFYEMMVSRNFINPNGFDPALPLWDTTNVNYDYKLGGAPLSDPERIRNIANLYYDPRPPVYVKTNEIGALDFRFYLDFNRNSRFDTNGVFLPIDDSSNPLSGATNEVFIGDPEWIGVLEKPELPHSPTNRFIGRYAFFVLPQGKQLDVNYIHNYAKGTVNNAFSSIMPFSPGDGFMRNQGFGSWELNLAAFLQDLNTNIYQMDPYQYQADSAFGNTGYAFEDAFDILRYRYATNHSSPNLKSAELTLGFPAIAAFTNDLVDGYANGDFITNAMNFAGENDETDQPWAGSRNPNRFTDVQELFDPTKTSTNFVNRLRGAMAKTNSYDRYTYYRLLTQLGTQSPVDNTFRANGKEFKKVHINYDNFTSNTLNFASQTNFFEWAPSNFFFHAAEALIQKSIVSTNGRLYLGGVEVGTNFSVTNIQIYPTNQYTPTLHRLLQLAANVYAATTNGFSTNAITSVTNFPYVFRPYLWKKGTNVVIAGYYEDGSTTNVGPFVDIQAFATDSSISGEVRGTNIYGVPWVLSAKKGLPNFNEFSLETVVQLTRKLEFRKDRTNEPPTLANGAITNQMYVLSINNVIGNELWNSYTSAYRGSLTYTISNTCIAFLTNELGVVLTNNVISTGYSNTVSTWPGAVYGKANTLNTNSFLVRQGTAMFLPESQYWHGPPGALYFTTNNPTRYETDKYFYVPDWTLLITNRMFCVIKDANTGRIVDLVSFDSLAFNANLTTNLLGGAGNNQIAGTDLNISAFWRTNRDGTSITVPTEGIRNQIIVSRGQIDPRQIDQVWLNAGRYTQNRADEIRKFNKFFLPKNYPGVPDTNRIQAPFTPTVTLYFTRTWQANDPLVHYTAADMQPPATVLPPKFIQPPNKAYAQYSESNLGQINNRYSPWGGKRVPLRNPDQDETVDPQTSYNLGLKDPMVRWSDEWDFPTNKFPSIGWLGRVHRGTPWQTVYLKGFRADPALWTQNWAGSPDTHPTNDWALLDVFTVAPNDNAARGLLSVNQTNMAAWSAALSGVNVLSNSQPDGVLNATSKPLYTDTLIEPSSIQLSNIVNGINAARARRPKQVFESLGEVLSADELSVGGSTNSPFLNLTSDSQRNFAMNDVAYERIPQQILSLLKTDRARLVVYSFGQALKPAENSIVLRPPTPELFNICTNYQITGEVWTRSVVRIDERVDSSNPSQLKTNYQAVIESFDILE